MRVFLLSLFLILAGCSSLGIPGLGGGTNVAANTQVGENISQTVGTTSSVNADIVRPQADSIQQNIGDSQVKTERVETIVVNERVPAWIWILVILGWLLPSPSEIGNSISRWLLNLRQKKTPASPEQV